MKIDKKPVVPDNLSNIIVVYGEDESEAYRSQATNLSQVTHWYKIPLIQCKLYINNWAK